MTPAPDRIVENLGHLGLAPRLAAGRREAVTVQPGRDLGLRAASDTLAVHALDHGYLSRDRDEAAGLARATLEAEAPWATVVASEPRVVGLATLDSPRLLSRLLTGDDGPQVGGHLAAEVTLDPLTAYDDPSVGRIAQSAERDPLVILAA